MKKNLELSSRILNLAWQKISCHCPGFAAACSRLTESPEDTGSFGTDGLHFKYQIQWILREFSKNGLNGISRACMHTLLHCLYLHMCMEEKGTDRLWNLACDIVAEYTLDYLGMPNVFGEAGAEKEMVYARFWKAGEARTAEELAVLLEDYSGEEIEFLERLYRRDDHTLWRNQEGGLLCGIRNYWKAEILNLGTEGGSSGKMRGSEPGEKEEWYSVQKKRKLAYRRFLRRFTEVREEVQLDMESFDYIPYYYGMQRYKKMPLLEPLEYMEAHKIEEMVIAIDTSSSCSRKTVQRFLEETYAVLSERENFFRRMRVHIIQCDCYVQEDVLVTKEEVWKEYLRKVHIQGRGGTDFRPVFQYVDRLISEKQMKNLKGLLYFTDGDGIYPTKAPSYETAFLFSKEPPQDAKIPCWAVTLRLEEKEEERGDSV